MKKTKKNLVLTWGWTWGHAVPLASVYNFLKDDKAYNFYWAWNRDSIEEELAEKHNIPFLITPAGKIRRYFDIKNFFEPLKNITGFFYALYYILRYKIDIVFSKWGYVSIPFCLAAFILRRKIYIHESDAVTGFSNKLISKLANKVFYTFPTQKANENPEKHIVSWQILNPSLLDSIQGVQVEENLQLEVLVIAGSQGSTRIFEGLIKILPDFTDINFTVLLGTQNEHFKEKFSCFSNVKTYNFLDQKTLGTIYKKTDIAITRGSSALWELVAFGIHSIIVPLSESAGGHQKKNAEFFNKKYGSDIVDEQKNFEVELFRKIKKYKNMRKAELNLNSFFDGLKIIEKEIS